MGYDGYEVEGALYGFKTELLEMLRDGDIPNWVHLSRRQKRIFKRNSSGRATAQNYFNEKVDDPIYRGGLISFEFDTDVTDDRNNIDAAHTPERIANKCLNWLESNRDRIEYRDEADFVEFRYFALQVHVGERGGINDVDASATFKNH